MTSTSYPFPNINIYFVYCMRLERAYSNLKKYNPSNPVFITNESDEIVKEVYARAKEEYNKIHGTEVFWLHARIRLSSLIMLDIFTPV